RNKWGYQSLVLSDCSAINNFYTKGQHETHPDAATASAAAVLAGTDLECGTSYEALIESLKKGLINEADLDVALRRILRSRIELGMFDPEENIPWKDLNESTLSSSSNTALALKAAREAMVLLKNDGVLPLSKNINTIAVVGPNANDVSMHNGNYNGIPTAENTISIVDAIRKAVPGTEVIYEKACELADKYLTTDHMADINDGKGLYAEFFNNQKFEGTPANSGYYTTVNMRTFGDYRFADSVNQTNISARLTGKFVAGFTGNMYYSLVASDTYKFTLNGKKVAEQKEPARGFGWLRSSTPTTTFPVVKGQTYNIQIDYTKGDQGFAFLSFSMTERNLAEFDALAQKVQNADAIVVVGGLSARLEGEEMPVSFDGFSGGDRTKIELPDVQKSLLEAMHKTGKPVILVNCSGSAMGFGDIESQYNALLQAWYGGQAAGIAVADVLFGDYNPAGRLPVTFYKSTDQLPDFENYDMEGRTYRYFREEPLYAFGYGLSYTTFEYGNATLSKNTIKAGKGVSISIPVTNSGNCDGDEVVQVYVKSLDNPSAPIKSLKGFKRVPIAAGITTTVTIDLESKAFEFYNETVDELAPRAGKYQIMYGSSSNDADLKTIDFEVL
ncbi:MAG: glycoside hydrolase family 3 C-terminal domain-containing protein, partial [Bacteroidales bacterium]